MDLLREKMKCSLGGGRLNGLFGGGNSSTTNETFQEDNRRVIGEGGVSAESSTVNVTNNDMSADVVDRSLSFAQVMAGGAAHVIGDTVDGALNFAGDSLTTSLNTVNRAVDGVLTTVGDTVAAAFGFGGAALKANADLADSSMAYSAQQARGAQTLAGNALGIANDSFLSALQYGAKMTDQTFGTLHDTESLVKDAYADAKGRGALTDKILIGAILAMAVVAFAAIKK